MPQKLKAGDLLRMRVLSVEPGLIRVDFDGIKLGLEMPVKPMNRKRLKAQIEKITRTWEKHYGKRVNFRLGKALSFPEAMKSS
jgi:hypothetical protein